MSSNNNLHSTGYLAIGDADSSHVINCSKTYYIFLFVLNSSLFVGNMKASNQALTSVSNGTLSDWKDNFIEEFCIYFGLTAAVMSVTFCLFFMCMSSLVKRLSTTNMVNKVSNCLSPFFSVNDRDHMNCDCITLTATIISDFAYLLTFFSANSDIYTSSPDHDLQYTFFVLLIIASIPLSSIVMRFLMDPFYNLKNRVCKKRETQGARSNEAQSPIDRVDFHGDAYNADNIPSYVAGVDAEAGHGAPVVSFDHFSG